MNDAITRLEFRPLTDVLLVADAIGDSQHPAVLLLHGGGQTRHAWRETMHSLAANGWYAVSLDLRGHGDSSWVNDSNYSLDAFANDVLYVAQQLPTPPVVVGASLGGLSALLAIGEFAKEKVFGGLVLVDITPRMEQSGVSKVIGFMVERAQEGFATLEDAADAIASYLPHRKRPKDLSGLAKNLRLHSDGRYRWHWDPNFLLGPTPPRGSRQPERLMRAAKKLTLPTLLVRGKQSELVSQEAVDEFLELVPNAEFKDIAGARHMVVGDQNDPFTDAILQFLEKLILVK